ncbi:hypothetical protein MUDAN_DOGOELCO_02237 [Lactiplantibacillus mudanjiangensis]|nr:hypothetical protein [Lactiplantibacillus mudanjiangensis]VDG33029.1 hypothetical protein MUDAN_DOGOELCO_02237 [Lactiplantibacillus mudanjiangensis]
MKKSTAEVRIIKLKDLKKINGGRKIRGSVHTKDPAKSVTTCVYSFFTKC